MNTRTGSDNLPLNGQAPDAQPVAKVLIADDEVQVRRFLRATLAAHGHEVVEAAQGEEAISVCAREQPDVVLIDLGLPDMDGIEAIRRIRDWSPVPIIVLSVRDNERAMVEALDAGADDYVIKPFRTNELMARLRVMLRGRKARLDDAAAVVECGRLRLDLAARRLMVEEAPIHLTRREFDLLALLMKNANKVMTHKQILGRLWGAAHEDDVEYLRVYIKQLRTKVEQDPAAPRYLVNEPGVGYRFVEDAPTEV